MADNNLRDIVLNILMDIETNNTFSNIAIGKALKKNQFSDKMERAFITRLAEGVVETKITLDYVINKFSKTKTEKCRPMIRCLLRMGCYQILYMNSVPDSAACNEAVKLAKKHGLASLSGFVNGVLRSIAKSKDAIEYPDMKKDYHYAMSIKYSMPKWLVEKLMEDYKDQGEKILEASFLERGTTIRVNTMKITVAELKEKLAESGICVRDGYYDPKALIISGYDFIRKVFGYRQGYFTVQDESSMCAVRAAGIQKGNIVVDVCAAPGGKTTAAAEFLDGTGRVYSMDISEEKTALIEENVERLSLDNVSISVHDARAFMDIEADVVIADVPCSGLGVMGKKNDIKYRLTKEGMDELIIMQREIMEAASAMVRKGGTFLYCTCTINPAENKENVEHFLKEHGDFSLLGDRLFLQGVDKCDGFYYAVLRR